MDLLAERVRPDPAKRQPSFWVELLDLSQRHRVHLVLNDALSQAQQPFPNLISRTLLIEAAAWQAKREVLLSVLEDVSGIAADSGVDVITLKGANLAERLYPNPLTRVFRDLDLMVRPAQFSAVLRALCSAEYRVTPGPYSGIAPETLVSWRLPVTLSPNEMPGITIDLHSSPLSRLEAFHFPAEPFWERARSWKYGVKELADVDFFLLLFVHAMKHGYFDLLNFLDLERASNQEALCGHLDGVLEFASRYHFSACIWAAMEVGRELLGTKWPVTIPQFPRVRARFVAVLTRKAALAARPWISERVQLLVFHPLLIDGWRKRLHFLRLLLLRPRSTIGTVPFKSGFLQNPWAFTVRLVRSWCKREQK